MQKIKNITIIGLILGLFLGGRIFGDEKTEFRGSEAFRVHFPQKYLEKYDPGFSDLAAKKENTKTIVQFSDRIEGRKEDDQPSGYLSGLAAGGATGLFVISNWALAGLGAPFLSHTSAIVLIIFATIAGMLCTYSTRLRRAAIKEHIQSELDNA